jgi:eukaryotic-like serine/threonine-protein kinase
VQARREGLAAMPTGSTGTHDDRSSLVQSGEILLGKYRVERVLGAGSMGKVVAAIHLQLRERVAIKLLRPEAARFDDAHGRFLREARAVVRIKSEHVARVTDIGVTESGIPVMVMEYLEGSDLSALLQEQGPLSVTVAVDYLLQACEAIAEAHMLGIIHRDLKPANLFMTRRADGSPCIKVLDFGISKVALADPTASDVAMAQTSALMGTPFYMSPEQLESTAGVDARTDIWSLGVTLYELLTGTWPFSAPTLPQLCTKILTAQAPPVRRVRPDVPPELESAIARCLARDLGLRFANVAEFASAITPFGSPRAQLSAERVSLIISSGERSGSHPVLPAVEERSAETWQSGAITLPFALQKQTTPIAGGSVADGGTISGEAWGGTLQEKEEGTEEGTRSRTALRVVILGGIGLLGLAMLGLILWRRHTSTQESLATPSSAVVSSHAGPAEPPAVPMGALSSAASAAVGTTGPIRPGTLSKGGTPARPGQLGTARATASSAPSPPPAHSPPQPLPTSSAARPPASPPSILPTSTAAPAVAPLAPKAAPEKP